MSQATLKSKMEFWAYRLSTTVKSFKELYSLSPEKVNAFVKSYDVFNHEWQDEEELVSKLGKDYYPKAKQEVINYYSVLNHLCAIGQVEKMYIPPAIDLSKSITANQKLLEQRIAKDLRLKKGDKVLDIGCGRGRIAGHIASISGAHVTGMNIDTVQLESAVRFAKAKGLPCQFQVGDLNDLPLPFADSSLDGIYEVQVFTYSKDLLKLFKELHRVLKPGARFACLDWFSLDNYDPKNEHHADLMRKVKPLIGAIGTRSTKKFVDLLKKAGFEIIADENPSVDGLQAPLIDNADKFFTRVTKMIKFLVKIKVLPGHFIPLFDRMTQDGQAFVEADRLRIMTSCHYVVGQKKG